MGARFGQLLRRARSTAWVLPLILAATAVRAQRADEWRLKLAVIENIASFITWPPEAGLDDPSRPFVFTFLGDTPLADRASTIYARRRFRNHPVRVVTLADADAVGSTHVLFVAGSESNHLDQLVARLDGAPTLTVGNAPDFARRGVAVNLYAHDDTVRFEINPTALRRANLRASYHVLRLARIVDERGAR